MEDTRSELDRKKSRLDALLDQRSKANCDTRHLSAADLKREQEIEDLEEEVRELQKKLPPP